MEHTVDDHCEYWEDECCCNINSLHCGQVTTKICNECSEHKVSIKTKSIKLLHELFRLSSNAGFYLEKLNVDGDDEINQTMLNLSEKLNEIELFLESVGVVTQENKDA